MPRSKHLQARDQVMGTASATIGVMYFSNGLQIVLRTTVLDLNTSLVTISGTSWQYIVRGTVLHSGRLLRQQSLLVARIGGCLQCMA